MPKSICTASILQFDIADLPETKFGVSVHKGVIVCWDYDRDARILEVIDDMPKWVRKQLVAVHETKGQIYLTWEGYLPDDKYMKGSNLKLFGDTWYVAASGCVGDDTQPRPDHSASVGPFDV